MGIYSDTGFPSSFLPPRGYRLGDGKRLENRPLFHPVLFYDGKSGRVVGFLPLSHPDATGYLEESRSDRRNRLNHGDDEEFDCCSGANLAHI